MRGVIRIAPFIFALNFAANVLVIVVLSTARSPMIFAVTASLYAATISYSIAIRTGEFASVRSLFLALLWIGVSLSSTQAICFSSSAGLFLTLVLLETPEQRVALLLNWLMLVIGILALLVSSSLPISIIASALGAGLFVRLLPQTVATSSPEPIIDLERVTVGDDGELVIQDEQPQKRQNKTS